MPGYTISDARQLETAIRFVLMQLEERGGECPRITRKMWREATGIMHLSTAPCVWRARKPVEPYLEAAGIDARGTIVDYEKFYANREAWAQKRRAKRARRRGQQA